MLIYLPQEKLLKPSELRPTTAYIIMILANSTFVKWANFLLMP